MDINDYDSLLDKAYDKIPENAIKAGRFVIPTVQVYFEGKNTYITNFFKIINTLGREKNHFLGVFLKNSGTFGEIRGQQLFMKSTFKEQVLNRLIENYTKTYVLCRICNKPDTEMEREGKKVYLKCGACGAHEEIREK